MSEHTFFAPVAKERATAAVKSVEARTAAEVVIVLRQESGHYRHVDYLVGFVFSLAALVAALLLPHDFALLMIPLDVAIAFVLGTVVSAYTPFLRRLLARPSLRELNVRRAAKAAFVDLGISRTSGRTGILVYVSMLERRAEVVPDIGIDVPAMGEGWSGPVGQIKAALRQGADLERFLAGVLALAPALEKILPRSEDDVNELPDQVQ